MTLPTEEFLRRFLQHVLPKGTHKVRYYGLLSPTRRIQLKRLQLLLAKRHQKRKTKDIMTETPAALVCPCCATGTLVLVGRLPRGARSPPQSHPDYNGLLVGAGL